VQILIEESKKLKEKGVHAVIVTAHVGNQCERDATYGIWTSKNMGNMKVCDKYDEVFKLLD
jgi:hypothetical protein